MFVRIDFFDGHDGTHDYAWQGDLDVLPSIGHEISLPKHRVELPLRAAWDSTMTASNAKVFDLTWYLDDEDGPMVAVFASIEWERDAEPE
mgnify:FL=1